MALPLPNFGDKNSLFDFVVRKGNGVKGMVDSGISQVPESYIQPPEEWIEKNNTTLLDHPAIDLSGLDGPNHDRVVGQIALAAETLGFFQVVNHGVRAELLEELKVAAHEFFGQSPEKKAVYLRGVSPSPYVNYGTSFVPEKEKALEWKDYVSMVYTSDVDALEFWPSECKEILDERVRNPESLSGSVRLHDVHSNLELEHRFKSHYHNETIVLANLNEVLLIDSEHIPTVMKVSLEYLKTSMNMVKKIFKALMEKLGVTLDESRMESLIGLKMVNMNFYPACPNPNESVGVGRHSDMGILTVLLQDGIGGLFVRVENDIDDKNNEKWVEIPPIPNALVINIGDALQVLSNGRYKSAEHRVRTTSTKSRVSVPIFTVPNPTEKIGPLPEAVESDGVARYREFVCQDYANNFFGKAHDGKKSLDFAIIASP